MLSVFKSSESIYELHRPSRPNMSATRNSERRFSFLITSSNSTQSEDPKVALRSPYGLVVNKLSKKMEWMERRLYPRRRISLENVSLHKLNPFSSIAVYFDEFLKFIVSQFLEGHFFE